MKHNQINKVTFDMNKYEKHDTIRNETTRYLMTNNDQIRNKHEVNN